MSELHFEPVGQRVAVLAASLFSLNAYHYFHGDKNLDPLVAMAVVLPLAAVVHSWTEFILCQFPMRFRSSRRLLSRTASIEGYWFEGLHSREHPYSVICIEFDPATSSYRYHGINYRRDYVRNSMFSSVQTSLHDSGNGLTFHFEATVHEWSSGREMVGTESARGYGRISFTTENSSEFVRGRGEFFETNPKANWHSLELYRFSDQSIIAALGGRTHAVDDQDYDRLLVQGMNDRRAKRKALEAFAEESGLRLLPPASESSEASANDSGGADGIEEKRIEPKEPPNPAPQADG